MSQGVIKKDLFYTAIFIDTCFFVGDKFNFYKAFFDDIKPFIYSYDNPSGLIKFYITDVVKNEMIKHFSLHLNDAENEFNQSLKKLKQIFKGKSKVDYFNGLIDPHFSVEQVSEISFGNTTQVSIDIIDQYIEEMGIIEISSNNVKPTDVFELYFSHKAPFSNTEKKKYEFPDAFSLLALEKLEEKILILSTDNDLHSFVDERQEQFGLVNKATELISVIKLQHDNIDNAINQTFSSYRQNIKDNYYLHDELTDYFNEGTIGINLYCNELTSGSYIELDDYYTSGNFDIDIDNIKFLSINTDGDISIEISSFFYDFQLHYFYNIQQYDQVDREYLTLITKDDIQDEQIELSATFVIKRDDLNDNKEHCWIENLVISTLSDLTIDIELGLSDIFDSSY